MVVRSGMGSRLACAAVVLILAGCASSVSTSPGPTMTAPATPSEAASASALAAPLVSNSPNVPTPTLPDPAPAELIGAWKMTLGTEPVTLTLGEHFYRIRRAGDDVSGRVAVRGDQIEFSKSTVCDGIGTYQWSLKADALHFKPIGVDPCAGRAKVLDDKTYSRAAP
jgi:hypothetical protein